MLYVRKQESYDNIFFILPKYTITKSLKAAEDYEENKTWVNNQRIKNIDDCN